MSRLQPSDRRCQRVAQRALDPTVVVAAMSAVESLDTSWRWQSKVWRPTRPTRLTSETTSLIAMPTTNETPEDRKSRKWSVLSSIYAIVLAVVSAYAWLYGIVRLPPQWAILLIGVTAMLSYRVLGIVQRVADWPPVVAIRGIAAMLGLLCAILFTAWAIRFHFLGNLKVATARLLESQTLLDGFLNVLLFAFPLIAVFGLAVVPALWIGLLVYADGFGRSRSDDTSPTT